MSYEVYGYRDGKVVAKGDAEDVHEALRWASDALSGTSLPVCCDEVEVMSVYEGTKVQVAYIYDDDRALAKQAEFEK